MATHDEIPLAGGRVNEGVVRIGDTVRRPTGPHSPFVHQLLSHLEQVDFAGAPRFMGIDEQGREVLSVLPGSPLAGTSILTDNQIVSAATLLRGYHDAASSSRLAADAETVVHGDPGMWNILWQGEHASGLIDFDEARPGRCVEDIGYFVWKGLRLVADGPELDEQRRRVALFANAYGVRVDDDLLNAIPAAIVLLCGKGAREDWPKKTLAEIEGEARWVREKLPYLR